MHDLRDLTVLLRARRLDVKTWVRRTWRDPIAWTDVIQLVKTVIAAVAAWVLATQVFDLPQPFLARGLRSLSSTPRSTGRSREEHSRSRRP